MFCGIGQETEDAPKVKEISVKELETLKDSGEDFQLIDVREPYEYEIANMGGVLLPLGQIEEHVDQIVSGKKVVVHCRSGARSAKAILALEKKFGFSNLYNLKGGILAYADEIDNSLAKY
jgi:adenylyltransferase/sulfurtransferase